MQTLKKVPRFRLSSYITRHPGASSSSSDSADEYCPQPHITCYRYRYTYRDYETFRIPKTRQKIMTQTLKVILPDEVSTENVHILDEEELINFLKNKALNELLLSDDPLLRKVTKVILDKCLI